MKNNKVFTYLLYAVGEILLVVIGILIAVQIDDWNQEKINNKTKEKIISSLQADLRQDIIYIDSTLNMVKEDLSSFDSLQAQLTSINISEAEVIELIKTKYNPLVAHFFGFNDNTYRSAVSNGNIELLSDSTKSELYSHYLSQSTMTNVFETYQLLYIDAASNFIAQFPLQGSFVMFNKGYVYDRKWQNTNFDLLTTLFNNVGTSKKNYYRILYDVLESMKIKTHQLIQKLEPI